VSSGAVTLAPHLPRNDVNTGPLVSFARSGIAAHWNASQYESILELAEACEVRSVGRAGPVFVTAVKAVWVSGAVVYGPEPLDKPAMATFSFAAHNPLATRH